MTALTLFPSISKQYCRRLANGRLQQEHLNLIIGVYMDDHKKRTAEFPTSNFEGLKTRRIARLHILALRSERQYYNVGGTRFKESHQRFQFRRRFAHPPHDLLLLLGGWDILLLPHVLPYIAQINFEKLINFYFRGMEGYTDKYSI